MTGHRQTESQAAPQTESQGTAPARQSRLRWEVIAAITAMGALVVALATWLVPHPGEAVCSLTGRRAPGCSDVPEQYLGTWQGHVKVADSLLFRSTAVNGSISTVTIHPAQLDEGIAAAERPVAKGVSGGDAGCSQKWQLTAVTEDSLEFDVVQTVPNDIAVVTSDTGCPVDLTVVATLESPGKLRITWLAGPKTHLLIPPGTLVFQGTLHRQ